MFIDQGVSFLSLTLLLCPKPAEAIVPFIDLPIKHLFAFSPASSLF